MNDEPGGVAPAATRVGGRHFFPPRFGLGRARTRETFCRSAPGCTDGKRRRRLSGPQGSRTLSQ
jgi:hypothetical protein